MEGCGRRGPRGPGGGRYRRAVLEPAILLSLLSEERHGYDLIEPVEGLVAGEVCVDPGSVYRLLRGMEDEGLVSSAWEITARGPNRRTYTITGQGREALAAAAEELRRRARALAALAQAAELGLAGERPAERVSAREE